MILNLTPSEEMLLTNNNIIVGKTVIVQTKIEKDSVFYTSVNYSKAIKSIDYFILLNNGSFGKAYFYIDYCNIQYVFYEEFTTQNTFHHISEVSSTDVCKVVPVEQIVDKFIFLQIGHRNFISLMPNPFEKD